MIRTLRPRPTAIALLLVALFAWPAGAEEAPAPAPAPALAWLDLDAGKLAAAESGRPLMIHFTAEWCKWCRTMQRETYTQPDVAELLAGAFVTARVDVDREPRRRAEYGVRGLPTIWFLDQAGEPITYLPGYADAAAFLPVLRWIASGAYRDRTFAAYLQEQP